jgi:spore germination cell wall hydrolase CwlJ-like protein
MRNLALVGIFFLLLLCSSLHAESDSPHYTSPIMDREVSCLTKAIYFESKSEPEKGQLAVGTVIVNRAESGQFPDTVCGVIHQGNHRTCQFQGLCKNSLQLPKINKEQWEHCKEIAQRILIFGEYVTILKKKKAIFFHAKYVHPKFAKKKYLIVQIGGHLFYSAENGV